MVTLPAVRTLCCPGVAEEGSGTRNEARSWLALTTPRCHKPHKYCIGPHSHPAWGSWNWLGWLRAPSPGRQAPPSLGSGRCRLSVLESVALLPPSSGFGQAPHPARNLLQGVTAQPWRIDPARLEYSALRPPSPPWWEAGCRGSPLGSSTRSSGRLRCRWPALGKKGHEVPREPGPGEGDWAESEAWLESRGREEGRRSRPGQEPALSHLPPLHFKKGRGGSWRFHSLL